MIAFKQKGPVNCTVVGSPTIVDGVASGFSTSNYLKTEQNFLASYTNYEVVFKAKLNATGGGLFTFARGFQGELKCFFRTNNIEVFPYSQVEGSIILSNTFSVDSYYYIRFRRNGNMAYLDYSLDGDNYIGTVSKEFTQWNTVDGPVEIGGVRAWGSSFNDGLIDLNETYIKLNGQPWFGVCTTPVSRVRLQGPVEYTVVGSPTIQNGIVSGFSTSNYLKSGGVFDFSHPFEVNISVKDFEGTGGSQYVFGLSAGSEGALTHSLGMYHGGQATGLSMSYGSNQYWSSLAPTLTAHVPYTINLSSDGTTVTVKVTQGNNSKTSTKALSDFATTGTCELRLGLWATYGQVFTSGSIDLNETYVRVNGKLWFGKEPVQKIVKDGVTVWEEV